MNIVITGASRGIGKAVVEELSKRKEECTIFALARNGSELAQLQQIDPSRIIPVTCDLSDMEQIKRVPEALKKVSSIDVLINNAALLINKPFEKTTVQDFQKIFQVNLFGIVALTQALIPLMSGKGLSHILNISSVGGLQNSVKFTDFSAYCASKAALINLTECLAIELKERNIHVNALALGAVQTVMFEQAFPDHKAPLEPQGIAPFIVDFAIHGHSYCNGKIIPVSLSNP